MKEMNTTARNGFNDENSESTLQKSRNKPQNELLQTLYHEQSISRIYGYCEDDINVLICSANLGNKEPTKESIAAIIPEKGTMHSSSSSFSSNHNKQTNGDQKRYDIIAIGVQEATFTPPNKEKSTADTVLTPMMNIAASVDHVNKKTLKSQLFRRFNLNDPAEIYGGTRTLQEQIQSRLGDEYRCYLHYQRGGMRLIIMLKEYVISEIEENGGVFVNGENTGIGSILPNKGGIFASITLRKTRISFLTAHLEALEGIKRYKNRCSNIAEILKYAKVGPTIESRIYDASLSSHYCFVFGDLNFRIRVPNNNRQINSQTNNKERDNHNDKVKQVLKLIQGEQWHHLNEMDELRYGLINNDLLAGFETLQCCFPPTYKVEKGYKGYRYNGKRIPSYTDRILWKCADGLKENLRPLFYEPCPLFDTSDHKPIYGGFSITPSITQLRLPKVETRYIIRNDIFLNQPTKEYGIHLSIKNIRCVDLTSPKDTCNPYIMFDKDLSSHPTSVLSYRKTIDTFRKYELIEKLQESQMLDNMMKLVENVGYTSDKTNLKQKSFFRYGKPRTRNIKNNVNPRWDNKEEDHIIIEINNSNTSIESLCYDLCGSFLYLSAMHYDARGVDTLIGTVALNMERFVPKTLNDVMSKKIYDIDSYNVLGDILSSNETIIDQPLFMNGKVQGQLICSIVSFCYCYDGKLKMKDSENLSQTRWICPW